VRLAGRFWVQFLGWKRRDIHYPALDIVNGIPRDPAIVKTPLFYALPKCREDVVRYFVQVTRRQFAVCQQQGSNAASSPESFVTETCEYLHQLERQELAAGGPLRTTARPIYDEILRRILAFPLTISIMGRISKPMRQFKRRCTQILRRL
jgi:hypothetical protein